MQKAILTGLLLLISLTNMVHSATAEEQTPFEQIIAGWGMAGLYFPDLNNEQDKSLQWISKSAEIRPGLEGQMRWMPEEIVRTIEILHPEAMNNHNRTEIHAAIRASFAYTKSKAILSDAYRNAITPQQEKRLLDWVRSDAGRHVLELQFKNNREDQLKQAINYGKKPKRLKRMILLNKLKVLLGRSDIYVDQNQIITHYAGLVVATERITG